MFWRLIPLACSSFSIDNIPMITVANSLSTTTPAVLADYMLKKHGKMSHLKIQKLLYYIQAYHLAYFDEPLMNVDFEAWVHGPVCRAVFDSFRDKSLLYNDVAYETKEGDADPEEVLKATLASSQMDLIDEVLGAFVSWKGTELEAMSHTETPWLEARGNKDPSERCDTVINRDSMRQFYKQFLT